MTLSPTHEQLLLVLPTMAYEKLILIGRILDLGYDCPLLVKEGVAPSLGVLLNLMAISRPVLVHCLVDLSVFLVERWLID
jgi:hypothetical protein